MLLNKWHLNIKLGQLKTIKDRNFKRIPTLNVRKNSPTLPHLMNGMGVK
jgi:hypothetical protein